MRAEWGRARCARKNSFTEWGLARCARKNGFAFSLSQFSIDTDVSYCNSSLKSVPLISNMYSLCLGLFLKNLVVFVNDSLGQVKVSH